MLVADATDTYGEVASLYSQLTGVLAGFAFSGLVLLLTRRLDQRQGPLKLPVVTALPTPVSPAGWRGQLVTLLTPKQPSPEGKGDGTSADQEVATTAPAVERTISNSFVLLLASFLGLTVTSLGYAVLAGEPHFVAAATEHVVAGLGFAASALALLLAIGELLGLGQVASHVKGFTQAIVCGWAPLLVLVYIVTGVYQVASEINLDSYRWLNAGAVVAGVVPTLAIGIRSFRRATPLKESGYKRIAATSVALALFASLAVPVINLVADSGYPLSLWYAAVALGAASVWSTVFSWTCWTVPRGHQ